jgi:hypothetical protein
MADRTVKVRLEADISDFVTDIGVKAVAAVNRLERAAGNAEKRIGKVGSSNDLDKLGSKADTAGVKLTKVGASGEQSGKKITAAAAGAERGMSKLGDAVGKVDKAIASSSNTTKIATKNADAHANAVGRLRVAMLRQAEVQKRSNPTEAATAAAEESVKSAERAVKKFEKSGNDSGRSFTRGLRKWLTGSGGAGDVGKTGGTVFGSGFLGVLKTPILGPAMIAVLTAAVAVALPAVGAVAASAFVTAFGAGLLVLGSVVAAKSVAVKNAWNRALWDMAADLKVISQPFERTLVNLAAFARRTFVALAPELQAAFKDLAPAMSQFGDDLGRALERLGPAIRPVSTAFQAVLKSLGPAMQSAMSSFARGLQIISESVSRNPDGLSDLVAGTGKLFVTISSGLSMLNDLNSAFKVLPGGASAVTRTINTLDFAVRAALGPFALLKVALESVNALTHSMEIKPEGFAAASEAANQTVKNLQGVRDAAGGAGAGLNGVAKAAGKSAHETHAANQAAYLLATAFERQAAATQRSIDLLNRRSDLLLGLAGAEIDFQQAIDDATQSIKDNGRTHDINTQKGRDNARALLAVATAAGTQRDSMLKANDGNIKAAEAALAGRAAYIKLAIQMGHGAAEAKRMAAEFIKIPPVKRVDLQANITDLESKLATAKTKLKDPKLTATQKATLRADIKSIEAGIAAAKGLLASLPQSRTAKLQANKKDLEAKIAAAQKELANPNLTKERRAKLTADIGNAKAGIATINGMLAGLPKSKTVTLTTRNITERIIRTQTTATTGGHAPVNADGGYYPRGMYPSYADGKLPSQATIAPGKGGGMVQWAEAETGGEAFIPLAPSKRDRSEKILGAVADRFGMSLVRSFASGGINLANGQLVDIAYLLRQLGLPFDPTAGAGYKSTLAAANRANRAVIPARDSALAADRAEQSAKAQQAAIQRAITLQQRAVAAARAPKQKTKAGQAAEDRRVAAEQKKLIALQDSLYAAKQRVTKATKASNAADAIYKIRAEAAAKAVQANRDALEKLVAQQQAAVELAKQVSQGLTSGANIGDLFAKSLTGKGLLADLQKQGADMKKFAQLITQLRAQKLDEDLINQIIGKGSGQGSQIAQAILTGGLSMVNALNTAQANLENQANLIGAGVANAEYNTKVAGARAGGGDVTAGMTYHVNERGQEFFTAPINGQVIPANVDPNRYVRSHFGATAQATQVVREIHYHQANQFTGVSMAEADLIAQRANAKLELMNRGY